MFIWYGKVLFIVIIHCKMTNQFCSVLSFFEIFLWLYSGQLCFVSQQIFPSSLCKERIEKEKLETDAMFKLDHGGKDKEKLKKALPSLTMIQECQSGWKDDFQLNSTLRSKFRVGKWPLVFLIDRSSGITCLPSVIGAQ